MGRIQAPRRIGKVDTLEGRASKLMLCVRTKVITCAGKAKQRLLVLQGTARIYFKLLSTAAMVDSLAEKADEYGIPFVSKLQNITTVLKRSKYRAES